MVVTEWDNPEIIDDVAYDDHDGDDDGDDDDDDLVWMMGQRIVQTRELTAVQ